MFRTAIKGVLAHKLRLLTTGLAVMLGVAFMTGTLVFTNTIGRTFDNLFADVYKNTDTVVRAKAAFDGPQNSGEQRGRVSASLVDQIRRVDGVKAAEGDVFGYARLVDKNGEAMGNPQMGAPTIGGNWWDNAELNPFVLFAGRAPRADDEMVIDRKSAKDAGFVVGDTATVLVQGGPQQMRIVGIAKFGTTDSPGGASFAMFTTPVAQRLVGEPGKFDQISAIGRDGISQAELTRRIATVLPKDVEAVTGAKVTEETQSAVRKSMSVFTTFMLVFAVVALLVGAFMIFNTFSITVAQRTKENALLRAVGASKGQVLLSVLLEAVTVGVLASLVGLGVGIVVAGGLKAMLVALGFEIPAGGLAISMSSALVAFTAGVLVTVLAAVSPARKAGKVPPIAAMRQVFVGSTGYGSKQRVLVGCLVLVAGVGALFAGLFGSASNALMFVGLGVLLTFFGVSILGRTISLPLSRVLGWPLPRVRGVAGELARENAMRNPKRTAASASALMIGVGLVVFITIFASSTKASINSAIDKSFTGDFVVASGASVGGGMDPAFAAQLNRNEAVDVATGVRFGYAQVDGKAVELAAVDPTTAFELIDIEPLQGAPGNLDAGSIGVQEDVAKDKHLAVGDMVPVVFKDTGAKQLRVAVIYRDHTPPAGDYLLGTPAYDANFASHLDMFVYVKKAPSTTTPAALAAVEQVARGYPGTKVWDQSTYKQEIAKPVDQLLGLVYAMLALAIFIALLGIGNTLALSIFERTRELGLLRSVGMTRQQLRSTIRWESVIIALQGTVLGLGIGLFFGWALVSALHDEGIEVFNVPALNLAVILLLAWAAGVVAAILPARRAAKLDVLRAVASE